MKTVLQGSPREQRFPCCVIISQEAQRSRTNITYTITIAERGWLADT
jgi:hypothetical protein